MLIRSWLRSRLLSLLGPRAKVKNGTYFLNGHFVCKDNRSIRVQQEIFATLLKELSSQFDLLSPDEALESLHQHHNRYLCLTFDDGFQDNYNVIAPVSEQFNFRCLFFINPLYLGLEADQSLPILRNKYLVNLKKTFLTTIEVKSLADKGHLIGSHGLSHIRLNTDDFNILEKEIVGSKAEIEKITQQECSLFAYPFGGIKDISSEALNLATSTYTAVFASTSSTDSFELGGALINRRHFEGNWPASHINYFLSKRR